MIGADDDMYIERVALARWEARALEKPMEVAIKTLHPHLLRTEKDIEKLAQEIEMLAKINHPHIVRVNCVCAQAKSSNAMFDSVNVDRFAFSACAGAPPTSRWSCSPVNTHSRARKKQRQETK